MEDLIRALQILKKYRNSKYPTTCEHDELYICVDPEIVSEEDKKELELLGFDPDPNGDNVFMSDRFGSC